MLLTDILRSTIAEEKNLGYCSQEQIGELRSPEDTRSRARRRRQLGWTIGRGESSTESGREPNGFQSFFVAWHNACPSLPERRLSLS